MKALFALFTMIALCFTAVFFGSPYYVANELKDAYNAHDGAALSKHIDFTQLQPNIEKQLTLRFSQTLSQYPLMQTFGGDAITAVADEAIERAVANAVTADNIEQLVTTQGQVNGPIKELAAAWAVASNKIDLQGLMQGMIGQRGDIESVLRDQIEGSMAEQVSMIAAQAQTGEDSSTPELAYCGLHCFRISGMVKGYPLTLIMERRGFIEWQVVDIVLP